MLSDVNNELAHQLWLLYSQLKDSENDAKRRLELLEKTRDELGQLINELQRGRFSKSSQSP